MYLIKANDSFWTGSTWNTQRAEAREYTFTEGMDIIEKRFHAGIRKAKRHGGWYWDPVPMLERIGDWQ